MVDKFWQVIRGRRTCVSLLCNQHGVTSCTVMMDGQVPARDVRPPYLQFYLAAGEFKHGNMKVALKEMAAVPLLFPEHNGLVCR